MTWRIGPIRGHAQNLHREDSPTRTRWSAIRHGRAWLDFGARATSLRVEWRLLHRETLFGLGLKAERDDEGVGLALHALWLGDLWLHVENRRLAPKYHQGEPDAYERFQDAQGEFEIGYQPPLRFELTPWGRQMEWRKSDPWWRKRHHVDLRDLILGAYQYSEANIGDQVDVLIPMPERGYPATVQMKEATWRRPRWPFARRILRAHVEIPGGVPHPGKGENSWDCGEDAVFGSTAPARDHHEAVAGIVEDVLRRRQRYGGRSWRPQPAEAVR